MKFLKMRWLFNKRTAQALGWSALLLLVAVAVNVAGIGIVGDIQGWSQWLNAHARIFLIWRIVLYLALGYGWWRIRRRIGGHIGGRIAGAEGSARTRARLIRVEVAAVVALLMLEISHAFTL